MAEKQIVCFQSKMWKYVDFNRYFDFKQLVYVFEDTDELRYVEMVGTQKNTSTYEWFDLTKWALWKANIFAKVSVLKKRLPSSISLIFWNICN